jgi:NAD(P)-dependent dehydrogenase (short-subunit alcohol dehydrogenase family)
MAPLQFSPIPISQPFITPSNAPPQIFGATGHIGRSLARAALSHNDLVTAVGRTFEPPPSHPQNCLPLLCDVRVRSTITSVIEKSLSHWGRIDIIANCSGYGVIGACEDQDEADIRGQFETNFFGTLNILQLSLPYFRGRKAPDGSHEGGRYLIFSSTSGALGVPGLGPYCATKYAVEGLIESMLYEVDTFNIKATLVEPGHVRRDEPDSDAPSTRLPTFGHFFIKKASEAYSGASAPAGHATRMVQWLEGRQPSSARGVGEVGWQLGHSKFPPLRLLLGSFAVESVRDRLRCVIEEIEDWRFLSFKDGSAEAAGKSEGDEKDMKEEEMEGDGDGDEDMGEEDEGEGQDGERDGEEGTP